VESASIEVALRKLAGGLAAGFARLPGNAQYRRLAVLPFQELGPTATSSRLGAVTAAEIATSLQRDHRLLLVERARIADVLGELRLQQVLAVDPSQASRIGKMADAQALVLGSVAEVGDRVLITGRIVATETGETLAAESVNVQAAGLVAFSSEAVVLRSRSQAAIQSLLVPGWGQLYNRQRVKAYAVMGTEVALLGAAVGFHLAYDSAYSSYKAKQHAVDLGQAPSQAAQSLYARAQDRYTTRNWLLVGVGVVWVGNVLDAYLSGVDGEALLGGGTRVAGGGLGPTLSLSQAGLAAGVAGRF
jgi:TolB-like protein